MAFDFVEDDTGSKLILTAKDNNGTVIDLTGATVTLRFKTGNAAVIEQGMTITDAVNGVAEYTFASGELKPGSLRVAMEITDSGGKVITQRTVSTFSVRERLA